VAGRLMAQRDATTGPAAAGWPARSRPGPPRQLRQARIMPEFRAGGSPALVRGARSWQFGYTGR